MTTACSPNQCKKWSLLIIGILATLSNLGAFWPLVISFVDVVDTHCYNSSNSGGFRERSSYLLIQMGIVFLLSATSFTLCILTCIYTPTKKTTSGKIEGSFHKNS